MKNNQSLEIIMLNREVKKLGSLLKTALKTPNNYRIKFSQVNKENTQLKDDVNYWKSLYQKDHSELTKIKKSIAGRC